MKSRSLSFLIFLPALVFVVVAGCGGGSGSLTNVVSGLLGNNTSSVAGAPSLPFDQIPLVNFAASRAAYGTANSPVILGACRYNRPTQVKLEPSPWISKRSFFSKVRCQISMYLTRELISSSGPSEAVGKVGTLSAELSATGLPSFR